MPSPLLHHEASAVRPWPAAAAIEHNKIALSARGSVWQAGARCVCGAQAKGQGGSARCTLRDLCAEDKAKVASLIRQVVQAEQRAEEAAARAQRVRARLLAGRHAALRPVAGRAGCLLDVWGCRCAGNGQGGWAGCLLGARCRRRECGPDRASAVQEAAARQAELEELRARGSDAARENDRCPHRPGPGLPGDAPLSMRLSWPYLHRVSCIQVDMIAV